MAKVKKYWVIILASLFCVFSIAYNAQSQEVPEWGKLAPKTKDFESETKGQIAVTETREVEFSWTLDEIDYFLALMEAKKLEIQKQINHYLELKGKVKSVTEEIKLKGDHTPT